MSNAPARRAAGMTEARRNLIIALVFVNCLDLFLSWGAVVTGQVVEINPLGRWAFAHGLIMAGFVKGVAVSVMYLCSIFLREAPALLTLGGVVLVMTAAMWWNAAVVVFR